MMTRFKKSNCTLNNLAVPNVVFIRLCKFIYRQWSLSEGRCLCPCLTLYLSASCRCQEAAAASWTKWSWRTCTGRSRWAGPAESLRMRGTACFPSAERRRAWAYSRRATLGSGSWCTAHGQSETGQSTQRTRPEPGTHLHSSVFWPAEAFEALPRLASHFHALQCRASACGSRICTAL